MYELELKHQTGQITDKKFNERAQELRRLKKEAEEQKNSDSDGPSEIRERLKIAEAEQDAAHADVDAAAVVAQSAHDLMHEIRTEVSRLKMNIQMHIGKSKNFVELQINTIRSS